MNVSRAWYWGLACGLAFVVLDLAADNGSQPAPGASDVEITAFWQSHLPSHVTWLSFLAEGLAMVLIVVFAHAAAHVLAGGAPTLGARAMVSTATLMAAVKLVEFPFRMWIHDTAAAGRPMDPAVVGAFDGVAVQFFEAGWVPAGAFLVATAITGWSVFPRWFTLTAFIAAAAMWSGYAAQVELLGIAGWLGFLLLIAIGSGLLLHRFRPSRRPGTVPAVAR